MLATLQRHKLQVSCESRTTPASTAHVFHATWITKIAPQPRHFGLSLTSGPDTRWLRISVQGNKLGQYHCNHRRYDIRAARWISPDQASSPWWDLFDYVDNSSLVSSDPTGLGQKVVIATMFEKDPNKDDSCNTVEKWQKETAEYQSRSVQDFYAAITKKYFGCRKAGGSRADCCISDLVIGGHWGSGFGGREHGMSNEIREGIASMMCKDAQIINYQCFGGCITWPAEPVIGPDGRPTPIPGTVPMDWVDLSFEIGLIDILRKVGGTYRGYTGHTAYPKGSEKPWKEEPPPRFPGDWEDIKVKKGEGWDDLRKNFPTKKHRRAKGKIVGEEEEF